MSHSSVRAQARAAGVLYLLIIVAAGFAEGFVRSTMIVPGDPGATAANILGDPTLFRLGFAADLLAFTADAAVAVLLYLVLRSTDRTLALIAAAFRLIAHPGIGAVNLLNHLGALVILDPSGPASTLGPDQTQALAALALDLHGYGYVIAGAFFGVHCFLLGILLYRSTLFPATLGVLLGAAGLGYLFECFAVFIAPGLNELAAGIVVVTAGLGEVALCLYLLIRGIRPGAAEALDPART